MKDIIYYDPSTFEKKVATFQDETVDISEKIREMLMSTYNEEKITPIICDEKSIRVGIMFGKPLERRKKFRITIEDITKEENDWQDIDIKKNMNT